jgi:predicted phosphodiesterase
MRVAALYDIHGNLQALDAVLDDVRRAGVDRIVVGGDVFPGPMPRETLDRLLALDIPTQFIHGNGDRVVRLQMGGTEPSEVPERFRDVIRWTAEQLRPEDEQLLASWPPTARLEIPGLGGVLFCHATPRNDTEIFMRTTADDRLVPVFAGVTASVVVCGHSHMQFDRMVGSIRVVNAGSVGMPFQQPAGAYWLLLGPDVEHRRTDYDFEQTAARIRATGFPQAEDLAVRYVLTPPSEAETIALYAHAELK